ncbi:hypothetical protein SBRCBS47491_007196 [Sporothrix bragantina]|uniref:Endonuclease/exonuclease/phosphatase domain-containing protein n=1 Tax=Sporothrix bragantina TaxID=671064 RepID=A0ABP0CCC6_9PEZI
MASCSSSNLPPLPDLGKDVNCKALSWYGFSQKNMFWEEVKLANPADSPPIFVEHGEGNANNASDDIRGQGNAGEDKSERDTSVPDLSFATWNIDAYGYEHAARFRAIMTTIGLEAAFQAPDDTEDPTPSPFGLATTDVIFLQEVSGLGKEALVNCVAVRDYYVSGIHWMFEDVNHPFYNVILLSRNRFTPEYTTDPRMLTLGPVWMVNYPSRFGRYALCCDVTLSALATLRLVNVHLDSLPARPNLRPSQLAIVSKMLKAEGIAAGMVAGDFNPVIPEEDDGSVAANGLTDCWLQLKGTGDDADPGFTWGVSRQERFPPIRMDKVAIVNNNYRDSDGVGDGDGSTGSSKGCVLKAKDTCLLEPTYVKLGMGSRTEGGLEDDEPLVPASDHLGIYMQFGLN